MAGKKGSHNSPEHNLKISKAMMGNKSAFKTGRIKTVNGYIKIRIDHKYISEHRYLMEQKLGRPLTKIEVVHHKNGIKTDNRIENLVVMKSSAENIREHHKLVKRLLKEHFSKINVNC